MKWLPGLVLLFLWGLVINQLRPDWAGSPQYGYGWSVPFLAGYLLWRRWLDRPAPELATWRRLAFLFLGLLGLVFLPVRLVLEANADWRLLSWLLTAMVAGFTLALVYLAGGSRWLGHFLFPILFVFTAVPWPHETEHALVQSLMRAVASCTVELLTIVGVPALQSGNLIEVGSGLVGIDEACSGVRSFQSTLMASIFLGELYRFGWLRRLALVAIGLVLAFFLNVMRSFVLAYLGAQSGLAAVGRFHDQAGFTILLVCFFALWALTIWMVRKQRKVPATPLAAIPAAAPLPVALSVVAVGILIGAQIWVTAWYRSRESMFVQNPSWTVNWPKTKVAYSPIVLDEGTRKSVSADEGGGGTWIESDGSQWRMFYFRWLPGSVLSRILARTHRPEHCLPASGRTLVDDRGLRIVSVHGLEIPFRALVFNDRGRSLHVFFCLWEDRVSTVAPRFLHGFSPTSGRLKAVLEGQRRILGQQTLEFVVSGYGETGPTDEVLKEIVSAVVARTP